MDQFANYLELLKNVDLQPLVQKISTMQSRRGKVIAFGNGGSAANASHFCTGLSYVSRNWENPIRSVSLTQDANLITSLANDHGYENIFVRQLQVLAEPNDLLVVFSVSGSSENLVRALRYANEKDLSVVSFVGADGGVVKNMSSLTLHLPQKESIQGFVEDSHMILCHMLGYYLTLHLK